MHAITLSRTIAAFAALLLAGACNDTSGPGGQLDEISTGGMTIVPRNATLQAGQVLALKASLIDEHGDRLEGVTIQWTSTNDAVATVAATGEVFARGPGHAVITASALGKSQFSTVHVLPRGSKPDTGVERKRKILPNIEPARRVAR